MAFELFESDAPKTAAQFKSLVRKGFYDGKDFYRVVRGHVIQTGGGTRPSCRPNSTPGPTSSARSAWAGPATNGAAIPNSTCASRPGPTSTGSTPSSGGSSKAPRSSRRSPSSRSRRSGKGLRGWPCTSRSSPSSSAGPASSPGAPRHPRSKRSRSSVAWSSAISTRTRPRPSGSTDGRSACPRPDRGSSGSRRRPTCASGRSPKPGPTPRRPRRPRSRSSATRSTAGTPISSPRAWPSSTSSRTPPGTRPAASSPSTRRATSSSSRASLMTLRTPA